MYYCQEDCWDSKVVWKDFLGSRNVVHSKWLSDCICKFASGTGKMRVRVVGEGSHPECRDSSREVSEQSFSCGKGGWRKPYCDKSEKTRNICPLQTLQIESLHFLTFPLDQNDYWCKIDLKEASFAIPLIRQSRKYVRFKWSGNLKKFLCRCFGLGPAPKIFTKLL